MLSTEDIEIRPPEFFFSCICVYKIFPEKSMFFTLAPLYQICIIFGCPGSSIPTLGRRHRHFRIWTHRVTFETWDHSYIWSEWCLSEKTKRKNTKSQKDKKKKTKKRKKRVLYCDVRAVLHSCDVFAKSFRVGVQKMIFLVVFYY